MIEWQEAGVAQAMRWCSPGGVPAPRRVLVADDTLTADAACRLACEGTALLWRGDFQNARQLLQALARRIDRKARAGSRCAAAFPEAFHRKRMAQAQRARILGRLLIPFAAGHVIPLRRAPDVRDACVEALGSSDEARAIPLRELLGLIGAHEWRRKGVPIAALGGRIHPHYGVFSPVRGEYVALVAEAPLPAAAIGGLAFDIGAGTGVLAAVLARRGVRRVVATDLDPRALACARDNVNRLGLSASVEVIEADLFPPGRAPLIVCNPPWLPGKPASTLEGAVYDPDSRMLRGFLAGLASHLEADGEGWLILSDLAEHLKLRSRETLLEWIGAAGLKVLARHDTRPTHPKSADPDDPLHAARAAETSSLWRLRDQKTGDG
ncbi:MAG: class I SAM-dependent methyltransferase [Candidatus Accumulibacter sp.]|jgi:methylase of polypeptide subunit release factors|nr:class I SAM-dependent methyltransferase [Accumulibacter sp.]